MVVKVKSIDYLVTCTITSSMQNKYKYPIFVIINSISQIWMDAFRITSDYTICIDVVHCTVMSDKKNKMLKKKLYFKM